MPVIEVNRLTKEYRLGAMQGLKESVLNIAARLTGKKVQKRPLFKALDDVSFSIEQGEVVGIIGHNGAGKSTLLKMLARISTPTSGSVKVNGRIAPLIEVGAGFVPEFTGRENVYLNGAILGMPKRVIDRKFDEIVEFAEMAEFIDTPVKRYSSGMQVKLAFSVATSVDAEILIVDEVLAVGDLAFQRKCFNRMENLIKRDGRTVLLVSHNIRQIERMCERVLLLENGKIKIDGASDKVCNMFFEDNDRHIILKNGNNINNGAQFTGEVEIKSIHFENEAEALVDTLIYSKSINLVVTIRVNKEIKKPCIFIGFHTPDFVYLTSSVTPNSFIEKNLIVGDHTIIMHIENFPLLPGAYATRVSIDVESPAKNIYYSDNLAHFTVRGENISRASPQYSGGFIQIHPTWRIS